MCEVDEVGDGLALVGCEVEPGEEAADGGEFVMFGGVGDSVACEAGAEDEFVAVGGVADENDGRVDALGREEFVDAQLTLRVGGGGGVSAPFVRV